MKTRTESTCVCRLSDWCLSAASMWDGIGRECYRGNRGGNMNDVLFSHKTDLWETPQDFFDRLDDEFHFNLDAGLEAQSGTLLSQAWLLFTGERNENWTH